MTDDEYVDWVPTTSPSSPPTRATLAWVESELGESVAETEELVGGLSSAVHRLRFSSGDSVVLRRFTLADWMAREPNIPHDEARNLTMLGGLDLGVATPTLVAADPDGVHCDVPAIVMTDIAGRPSIDPEDPFPWAERIAACLARMHEQPTVAGLRIYESWVDPNRPTPLWTNDVAMWERAIELGRAELPQHPETFLHRDYHPNNIHWLDGEICGVVDWLSACTGPAAADIAHCRWNLVMLVDQATADHFTDHYRTLTGYSEDVWAFDLATVLCGPVGPFPTHAWNALGRLDLTSDVAAARIDDWLALLLD